MNIAHIQSIQPGQQYQTKYDHESEGGKMKFKFAAIISLVLVLLALPLLAACDGDNGTKKTIGPDGTGEVTITIGEIVDLTGVAAQAMDKLHKSLVDTAQYYNDENMIPGVKLEVKSYDNQYDPSRDIPGYNRLKDQGADVFFSPVSASAITLKPFLEQDKNVMFTVAPNPESFEPPGWVLAAGQTAVNWEMQTMLKWIAENDPDFPQGRPAKIGGAMWAESYGEACIDGAKNYAEEHTEQYEWVTAFLPDFKFSWATEVEELKNCDYIIPPVPMNTFVKEFSNAGYDTTYIGTDAHIAFLDMVDKQDLWEELDGMVVVKVAQWWTDEGEVIDMTKTMLERYRPGQVDEIIESGIGYLQVQQLYVMFELIKDTVEKYGAEEFSSELLFDNAKTFSITVDGAEHSYGPNKRTSSDSLTMYKVDKDGATFVDKLYRAEPNWIPIVYEP